MTELRSLGTTGRGLTPPPTSATSVEITLSGAQIAELDRAGAEVPF